MLRSPLIVSLMGALACAGSVRTTALAPNAVEPGKSHKGVVAYQPQFVKLTYAYTVRTDKEGNVLGTQEARTCTPIVQKEEITLLPDLSRPLLIQNASGAFSAAKLTVSLTNGMLASVNAEPTQKPSDLLSAVSTAVKDLGVLAVLPPPSTEACNASPRLIGFEPHNLAQP